MIKRFIPYIIALASIVSCAKTEMVPEGDFGKVVFKTSEPGVNVVTKTLAVTTSTLESSGFNVSATTGAAGSETSAWNNIAFSKDGDYFMGDKLWPLADPSYHFYAANAALTFSAGGTFITATNTTDVVCAYLSNPTYKEVNTLVFEHIFARIGQVNVTAESGFTLSGISVKVTPKTGGTYNLRTGHGITDGSAGWSSVTSGSATTIASATGSNSNDLYLVPGTYTLTVSWIATTAGGNDLVYTNKTIDVDLVAGKVTRLDVTLGGEIAFGVSLVDWVDESVVGTYVVNISSSGDTFSVAGGTKSVNLYGYTGTWSVSYSTDGGASFSTIAPSGVSVSRTAINGGTQTYDISMSQASPDRTDVAYSSAWPADAKHNNPIGTLGNPIDLSHVDIHGNALPNGQSTANTYVVSCPGTYMIPLVYGNAIENGALNPGSYSTNSTSTEIVPTLYNAYGTGISSSYIETDCTVNGHTITGAGLVWTEIVGMPEIESALQTHNGVKYAVFTIEPENIAFGNFMLSVHDEEDTIVWSWNIWVTANDLYDVTVSATANSDDEVFLSEAIGTVPGTGTCDYYDTHKYIVKFSNSNGQEQFYSIYRAASKIIKSASSTWQSVFFQFGRFAAMPRSNVSGYSVSDGNQVSYSESIKNPGVFYIRSASPYNWCSDNSSKFYNMWNMLQTGANTGTDIVVKTVYDPSPVGYHIPRRNAYKGFTTTGGATSNYTLFSVIDMNNDDSISSTDFIYGWNFKCYSEDICGIYFPAAGCRSRSSGGVTLRGSNGLYWSASSYSTDYAYSLGFYSGYVSPLNGSSRSDGFALRPSRN